MVTSVAIDDELRRKLKLLAAKYDTTQAEIIRRAIALLDAHDTENQRTISPKVKKELEDASKKVYKTKSYRKRISKALSEPGIDIDDLRMIFDE